MPNITEAYRDQNDDVPAYAWPGGYPIVYYTADGGQLCAACVNGGNGSRAAEELDSACPDDDQWRVEQYEILEGGPEDHGGEVRCDHCNTIIAFGEA
jgi:hypothetical protein